MITVGFMSLGCAKNLVDTEIMLGLLEKNQFKIIDNYESADVLIINTCGFIDSAKEESINAILEMAEYKKTGTCKGLIVAGCLGQRYSEELLRDLPEVDAIIGTTTWNQIVDIVRAVLDGKRIINTTETQLIYNDTMPRLQTTPQYSAYVKVAEGCDNHCAYCVIPSVRGNFRSRPIESIVKEVESLAQSGVKEINLIAQDTTNYGRDLYGKPYLLELLQRLVTITDIHWIRLLYCYPRNFSDALIDFIATQPKICKYIDLPLQHIHNDILSKMNRPDSQEEIEVLLHKIRTKIPNVAIRTSFIVGFPGETTQQFEVLKNFVLQQKFTHVGVFTYSQEEGTPAAVMKDQISAEVKEERYHYLMAIQAQLSEEENKKLEGSVLEVLVEGVDDSQPHLVYGRSYREAIDIDGTIYVENAVGVNPGEYITIKVLQGFAYDLVGEYQPPAQS